MSGEAMTRRETRKVQAEIERLECECRELRNRLSDTSVEEAWRLRLLSHATELRRLIEEEEK